MTAMNRNLLPRRASCALLLACVFALGACATASPVVWSERRQSALPDERTRADVERCTRQADERVGRNGLTTPEVASRAGQTAGVGAAAAVAGTVAAGSRGVWDKARTAAAAGAAGGLTKLLLEWNEPDEAYQTYVERCLEARGHQVLGWR